VDRPQRLVGLVTAIGREERPLKAGTRSGFRTGKADARKPGSVQAFKTGDCSLGWEWWGSSTWVSETSRRRSMPCRGHLANPQR